MKPRVLCTAVIVLASCGLVGCFRYSSVTPRQLRPDETVSVWLTTSGAASLASALGPRTTRLEGRVIAATDTTVTVSVTTLVRSSAQNEFWPGDSVIVSVSEMDSLRVRRMDGPRSLLASSGIVVAAIAGRALVAGQGFGRGGSGGPPVTR